MAEDNKNLEHTVLKLVKEGKITVEEGGDLLADIGKTSENEIKKTKIPKRHILRNLIFGTLIFAGGVMVYKSLQPNITKRTEEELRQRLAEGIDRYGHGYLATPMTTKGIDYDGKKYTIGFNHNKGTVIEKGREFILPMSVEKEGKISWYYLRVRDDKLVSMRRKGLSNFWNKISIKNPMKAMRVSKEQEIRQEMENLIKKLYKPVFSKPRNIIYSHEIPKIASKYKEIKRSLYGLANPSPLPKKLRNKLRLVVRVGKKMSANDGIHTIYNQKESEALHALMWEAVNERNLNLEEKFCALIDDYNNDGKPDIAVTVKNGNEYFALYLISVAEGYKIETIKFDQPEKQLKKGGVWFYYDYLYPTSKD